MKHIFWKFILSELSHRKADQLRKVISQHCDLCGSPKGLGILHQALPLAGICFPLCSHCGHPKCCPTPCVDPSSCHSQDLTLSSSLNECLLTGPIFLALSIVYLENPPASLYLAQWLRAKGDLSLLPPLPGLAAFSAAQSTGSCLPFLYCNLNCFCPPFCYKCTQKFALRVTHYFSKIPHFAVKITCPTPAPSEEQTTCSIHFPCCFLVLNLCNMPSALPSTGMMLFDSSFNE